MDNHVTAGAAENCAAGENLRANRGQLPKAWRASRPLELGEEIEEQQQEAKSGFRGEELFHAEAVDPQIMLQLGNAVFHVGAPVVVTPDLRRQMILNLLKGDEWYVGFDRVFAQAPKEYFRGPRASRFQRDVTSKFKLLKEQTTHDRDRSIG